jgi:hypothetical protein
VSTGEERTWSAPGLPDFSPTLGASGDTEHLGAEGTFAVISLQRPPRERNLDTRQRDFFGDSLGTGLTRGGFPTFLGSTEQ